MVKVFLILLIAQFIPDKIAVETPAQASVEVRGGTGYENKPIPTIISIIRERRQQVDVNSFEQNSKPLTVDFVEEIVPASSLYAPNDPKGIVTTKYRLLLPPRPAGRYIIDPISVKVGGTRVQTNPTTYTVIAAEKSEKLRLETKIIESPPYFPGQTLHFEYRIFFQDPVQLTLENLALFQFPGFDVRGAPVIETFEADRNTIQTITQEVIAEQAGTFTSGASAIEGFVYRRLKSGAIEQIPPLLHADAPSISITITPFPEAGKPASFTGAIGIFSWKWEAVSPTEIGVGDNIDIKLTVSGKGDFNTVNLPDFTQVKGFQENFLLDSPSVREEQTSIAKFIYFTLIPKTRDVMEIPSTEVSSFNPAIRVYLTDELPAIPISIHMTSERAKEKSKQSSQDFENVFPLKATDLHRPTLSPLLIGLCTLLFIALFVAQIALKVLFERKKKGGGAATSRDLILEALRQKDSHDIALQKITQALLLRLYETKLTDRLMQHPNELGNRDIQGKVKQFLLSLERVRFNPSIAVADIEPFIEEATKIYYSLRQTKTSAKLSAILLLLLSLPCTLHAAEFILGAATNCDFPSTGMFASYPSPASSHLPASDGEKPSISGRAQYNDAGFIKYSEALHAPNAAAAKIAFNEALSIYLQLAPDSPSGKLCFNIANCYASLGEYGQAALYYYRALDALPGDPQVQKNLEYVLLRAGLDRVEKRDYGLLGSLFHHASEYEVELLLLAALLSAFIFASLALWLNVRTFAYIRNLTLLSALFLVAALLWKNFLAYEEAIVIRPVPLFAGASAESAHSTPTPLLAGMKVQIIAIEKNGWLHVKLPTGIEGDIAPGKAVPI